MKKRTEKPEKLTREKLDQLKLTEAGKQVINDHQESMVKWRNSDKYSVNDFPRRRIYVVLLRNIKSKRLYAYVDAAKTKVSETQCQLFHTTPPYYSRPDLFDISRYRQPSGYNGSELALQSLEKVKKMKGAEDFEIFVSRIGSKKCPIKVKLPSNINSREFGTFKIKNIDKQVTA